MKLYLSGPMTGYADFNFPAFELAAQRLRGLGHEVISPHEINGPETNGEYPWSWYLRRDIPPLVECDAVVVLAGWEQSRGAALETHIARALGMPVIPIDDLEPAWAR